MRTRTKPLAVGLDRGNTAVVELVYVRPGYTGSKWTPGTSVIYPNTPMAVTWTESMTDGTGGGLLMCLHERRSLTTLSGTAVGHWTDYSGPTRNWEGRVTWSNLCGYPEDIAYRGIEGVSLFDTTVPNYGIKYPSDWETRYASTAVQHMLPRVRELVSLPNFIWEADEWKRDRVGGQFNAIINQIRDKTPSVYRYVRRLSWAAASSYLMLEFAFRPLVGDLKGISHLFEHVVKETRRLREWERRVVRSHYRTECTLKETATAVKSINTGWTVWQRSREVTWDPCEYHATMYFKYHLGEFTKRLLKYFAGFDALGANLSLQTVWDAIPFSFVIDWFARVGDFLAKYDVRAVRPTTTILGFVHSIKQRRVITRYVYPFYSSKPQENRRIQIAREVKTTYLRKPHIPCIYGEGVINLSGANLRELVLGSSLLRTRFKP